MQQLDRSDTKQCKLNSNVYFGLSLKQN